MDLQPFNSLYFVIDKINRFIISFRYNLNSTHNILYYTHKYLRNKAWGITLCGNNII